jgi:predicted MFS family arabinose efflux permease
MKPIDASPGPLPDRAPESPSEVRTPAAAWFSLALLTVVFAINQIDRVSMVVVMEPIKHEFHLSDSLLGLVSGLGYSMVYAVFAIPMGMLADRVNRKNLLAGLLAVWSVMTAACGLAVSFAMLLSARMVVGAAESGASPVSSSIISDLFPAHRRATAVAIYFMGVPVATLIAFLCGSAVASAFGWRATFLMAGVPGLLLAPLVLWFLKNPIRGTHDGGAHEGGGAADGVQVKGSLASGARELFGNPVLMLVFAGLTLNTVTSAAFQAWSVSLLMREHGLTIKAAGALVAFCAGGGGIVGALVNGPAADAFARGRSHRLALYAAGALLLGMASILLAVRGASMLPVVAGIAGYSLFSPGALGPAFSIVLNTTTPGNRGLMIATQQMCVTLVGTGVGPWVAGMISDAYGGPHSISMTLTTMAPIIAVAAACYLGASVHLRKTAKT